MPNSLKIGIADITISVETDIREDIPAVPPSYLPFIGCAKTDIRLRLHNRKPHLPTGERIFSSSPIWQLYRHQELSIVKVFEELDVPGSTLVFDDSLQTADLYPADKSGRLPDPFDGPVLELLMIHYLAMERGAVIHACGVEKDGLGIIFAGESGGGKSTLAQLWNDSAAGQVLSDDRTIISQKNGQFRMHGTPWHGEAKFGAQAGVELADIFFLEHSRVNTVRKIGQGDAVRRLLTCCFAPFWDVQSMQFTMDFFTQMANALPCHALRFVPDRAIIEMIKTDFMPT